MPTILLVGPYRAFFYASDRDEPMHVHVERDNRVAKFSLRPVRLQNSGGFFRTEIARLQSLVHEHKARFEEAWNAYFRD